MTLKDGQRSKYEVGPITEGQTTTSPQHTCKECGQRYSDSGGGTLIDPSAGTKTDLCNRCLKLKAGR